MTTEETVPRSVFEEAVDGRTDLIWKMKRAVEIKRNDAKVHLDRAVLHRDWQAISGLTILHNELAALNAELSGMVDAFAKS